MSTKSVDDLITKVESEKLNPGAIPVAVAAPPPKVEHAEEKPADIQEEKASPESEDTKTEQVSGTDVYDQSDNKEEAASDAKDAEEESSDVDPYGNEIGKKKTYTSDEVEEMMRDRLKRGRQQEQPAAKAEEVAQPAVEGDESWEDQLNKTIDKRVEQRERDKQEKVWRDRELQKQADFEAKFTTGMDRYKDFHETVKGKPITNSMMMAARGLDDPAAFIYAASKNHSKELERIAQMADPYQQAVEVGKLEASMRKRARVSKASPPPTKTKGDMPSKGAVHRPPIDDLIRLHAQNKNARGR